MPNAPATTPLSRRIETALKDGRLPQALELAKQWNRQEPGAASQAVLRKAYLASAEAQVSRGAFRDAHAVLTEAEKLPIDDPAWWERLAELRADLGDHGRAVLLLEKAPGINALSRILGRVVDRAVREGPAGKEMLPVDLRPQFDVLRQAFADYEAGHNEKSRETLNGIGLASPFLEWKLFLRGLMAWSANDSTRALDNWSRLSANRLPAKLADPFRIAVDKAYAATLPANRLATVARQADSLSGGATDGLRRLRKQLANDETIPELLNTASRRGARTEALRARSRSTTCECCLLDARDQRPAGRHAALQSHLRAPRRRSAILPLASDGHGSDAPPRQGPRILGQVRELDRPDPVALAGAQAARARALVLERMGRIARDWLDDEGDDDDIFGFFDFFERNQRRQPQGRKQLRPSPEECFRKAGELAPDWITPAMELLKEYGDNAEKAYPAVAEVLARFPHDLKVLECAADFYERIGDMAKAARVHQTGPGDQSPRPRVAWTSCRPRFA